MSLTLTLTLTLALTLTQTLMLTLTLTLNLTATLTLTMTLTLQKCGTEWDDRGNYPMQPDTSWAWVQMVDDNDPRSQPAVPYKPSPNVQKFIPGQLLFNCDKTLLPSFGEMMETAFPTW